MIMAASKRLQPLFLSSVAIDASIHQETVKVILATEDVFHLCPRRKLSDLDLDP